MTAAQALAIVQSVTSAGRGQVTVVVADEHGEAVALLRMDGAPLDTELNARRKAYAAARSDAHSTRQLADKIAAGELPVSFDPFFTFFLGGVAAFEDGRRVGAVGVSGLAGEVDEELSVAAIRAAGLEPPAGF